MPHPMLNARIITATNLGPVLEELGRAGAEAAARLLPAADVLAIALENVTGRQADLLKQESAAAGVYVAFSAGDPSPQAGGGDLVLSGARQMLQALAARLAQASPDLRALGEEVRRALEAHARRHFEIRMGSRRLSVGPEPAIMGVVNVTPDSFSDGGRYLASDAAVAHAHRLVEEGADLIDVGGESTRPGSDPVDEAAELERVVPVIETLASDLDVPISIDTRHARVAREAVAAGASLVNDITGLQGDPDMARAVAETGAGAVVMHIGGEPKTMQDRPHYDHLMADVCRFLRRGIGAALEAGVPEDRLLIDPGFGFGKTLAHNLEILARLGQLRTLGLPILVGPSRKRFIGELTGVETPAERTYGTAAACALAVAAGALVLRVHDVRPVRQALAVAAAVAHVDEKTP